MYLTTSQIMQNSLVVSIDNERFLAFQEAFQKEKLQVPKKFVGYEIMNKSFISQFQSFRYMLLDKRRGVVKQDMKIKNAICNNVSHWSIVQIAKFTDMPFVTIFEDDAMPVEGCATRLDSLCSDIPDEIDVLRLGYCSQFKRPLGQGVIDSAIPHSDNLIVKNLSGSHAYIVFKRYYDHFIEDNKFQPRCDFRKINPSRDKNVFALKESLFNQINLKDRPVITSWKLPDGEVIINR